MKFRLIIDGENPCLEVTAESDAEKRILGVVVPVNNQSGNFKCSADVLATVDGHYSNRAVGKLTITSFTNTSRKVDCND